MIDLSFNYITDISLKTLKNVLKTQNIKIEILSLLGNHFSGECLKSEISPLLEERQDTGLTILKLGEIKGVSPRFLEEFLEIESRSLRYLQLNLPESKK